ncbi:MAG: TIM barrel protein [Verrucomicrobiota bacterium]
MRRETEQAAADTLRKLPGLGFGGVETAGTYGWSGTQWKELLEETGLKVIGAHIGLGDLEERLEEQLEWARAVDCTRIVVPSLPGTLHNKPGFHEAAERLNALAPKLQAAGIGLFYHNHAFEFSLLPDGGCGMEILLQDCDPALVRFEVDSYWVEKGGLDSRDFIVSNAEKIGLLHAKEIDRQSGEETIVGQGDIEFEALCQLALKFDWPVVIEYEKEDALAAIASGAAHLKPFLQA